MTEVAPSAEPIAHPRVWRGVLVHAHRAVVASLGSSSGTDPVGLRNAKGDAVYAADLSAEKVAIRELQRADEPMLIVSEDSGETPPRTKGARYRAVVDPIDGSDNHVRALPLSALCVAVLPIDAPHHPDWLEAGIVGPLEGGDPWPIARGQEACRGLRPVATSGVTRLEDALVSVELNHAKPSAALGALLERARGVRCYGCTSRALALVADGKLDAHIDVRGRLTPESYVAGAALVTAAGGHVVGADGALIAPARSLTDRVGLIAAATRDLASALVEALAQ